MKIGIIADDLTGANATGVRLSQQGFSAATMMHIEQEIDFNDVDTVCINTDTRYEKDEVIKERIKNAMANFQKWETEIFCKRIDSTIRGNIGLEIDTVLEEVGENSVAILVASFPDSGRISSGGYLLVNSIPVHQTDVAKDPQRPITESYIPAVIQKQSKNKVAHVGLDKVLSGSNMLKEALHEKINEGIRIIVVDAITDEDIETIADAMVKIKNVPIVPADPGPLTVAYAKSYFEQLVEKSKIIVTVGSVTNLTGLQLNYLQEKTKSKPVYVNAEKVATLHRDTWNEEVNRAVNEALKRIDDHEVLIITTFKPGSTILNLQEKAEEENTTKDVLAKQISNALANITKNVIERTTYQIQGCFMSGGDITSSLCISIKAHGIKLEDEVLPLAAYGKLIGGLYPNLSIVTKGGMVGDKRSIYECVKYIKSKRTEVNS